MDEIELARTYSIASYQDNIANPFIIDSTLIRRIWFLNCYENITSDQLVEHIIEENNYYTNYDINSDSKINLTDVLHTLDKESGENAYFICD